MEMFRRLLVAIPSPTCRCAVRLNAVRMSAVRLVMAWRDGLLVACGRCQARWAAMECQACDTLLDCYGLPANTLAAWYTMG